MKKILLTGKSGFVGRNIISILDKRYIVDAPDRNSLDLKNTDAVENYVKTHKFDVIVHCANPNPVKNKVCDSQDTIFQDSLHIFMNFYRLKAHYEKLIYLGSGAEFNKSRDISLIKEEKVRDSLPGDMYGFAKYIMNEMALNSRNVYNLRLFACYGPYDHESKFITHCIRCCLKEEDITIRQNCLFDYLHVHDLAHIAMNAIESNLEYHDYNVASGNRMTLEEIAKEIKRQMCSKSRIIILKGGLNKEYTADISRLNNEFNICNKFISLEQGISMQIEHEKEIWLCKNE